MQIWEEPLDLLSYWPRAHLFNKYVQHITVCQRLATVGKAGALVLPSGIFSPGTDKQTDNYKVV